MNRTDPKTVVLLGVPFHDVTMEETLSEIDRIISERTPRYIATANLDFAAQASCDVELQRILMDADLVLCDGTPLVWTSRLLKAPLRERVAGSDLTPRLMAHAAARGYRIFFLGSDENVLAEAKVRLESENPGLVVCGIYAPPYARLLDLDHEAMAERIREANPDILLVALGAPKQEKWIYMNHRALGVPCSIGIGASLDFVAGKYSRAPRWMQRSGLEWLFRLMQEPRRLFARYFKDFTFFVPAFYKQCREQRGESTAPAAQDPPAVETSAPVPDIIDLAHYQWFARADAAAARANALPVPAPSGKNPLAILDVSCVSFMDSIGLGLVMKGYKLCKEAGGALILLAPSEPVRRLIETLKLDRLIPIAESPEAARAMSLSLICPAPLRCEAQPAARRLVFHCSREVTAANSSELSEMILREWSAAPWARSMEVNLSSVHFIDSSGLDCLVRARALAQSRRGGRFSIAGANENICNVLALARLAEPLTVKSRAA